MSGPSLPRRPRVGVDFHAFDGRARGGRNHLLGLYRAAIPMAPDLDFVFFLGQTQRLLREHPVFAEPHVRLVEMPTRPAAVRLGWQLPMLQRREQLDLLHMQSRLPARWPFLPHCPAACTFHDLLRESHPQYFTGLTAPLLRHATRHAAHAAALRFSVSEYTREQLQRIHGLDPAAVTVTPNGVDPDRFRPGPEGAAFVLARRLKPGGYVCTIGHQEPRKNHLGLLKALALMPRPRWPLVVISESGPARLDLQAAAHTLGVAQDLVLLDNVDDRELPALLRHAALFVYPSLAEGFGLSVVEAMASGVAVIASNATALPEVSGGLALAVNTDDPTELAAAMLTLLADPRRRQALALRARAHAAGYQWDNSAEVLVRALRRHFNTWPRGEAAPKLGA